MNHVRNSISLFRISFSSSRSSRTSLDRARIHSSTRKSWIVSSLCSSYRRSRKQWQDITIAKPHTPTLRYSKQKSKWRHMVCNRFSSSSLSYSFFAVVSSRLILKWDDKLMTNLCLFSIPVGITWKDAPESQSAIAGEDYEVKCVVQAQPAPTVGECVKVVVYFSYHR